MVGGNYTLSHGAHQHRRLEQFRDFHQFSPRFRCNDSATGEDQGALCLR